MKALLKRGQNVFGQKRFTSLVAKDDMVKNIEDCVRNEENDFSDYVIIIECQCTLTVARP